MSIFKAYDIRGVVPDEFNADLAYKIGRAYADWLHDEYPDESPLHVAVAADNRTSSPEIKVAAMKGVTEGGVDIVDIGLAATPVFYAAVNQLDLDGGLMITASHNPPQFNGIKMVRRQALPLSGETGIKEIEQLIHENFTPAEEDGVILKRDFSPDYVERNLKAVPPEDIGLIPFVVDTGNGVSAVMVEALLQKMPLTAIPLFFELDGTFPNRLPNPLVPENIAQLRKDVVEKHAHFGVALDADGDRIVFVDELGNPIASDLIGALVAPFFLKKNPGGAVIYDITCSSIVPEMVKEIGGKPVISRVGHAFIKPLMKLHHSTFGIERSGHFYFNDNLGYYEAPLQMLLAVLNILKEKDQPLSALIAELTKYFHTGEQNFEVAEKEAVMKKIKDTYADAPTFSDLDGIRIDYEDWWCNIRPSNTENILRLNLEAKTPELRDKKLEELKALIEQK